MKTLPLPLQKCLSVCSVILRFGLILVIVGGSYACIQITGGIKGATPPLIGSAGFSSPLGSVGKPFGFKQVDYLGIEGISAGASLEEVEAKLSELNIKWKRRYFGNIWVLDFVAIDPASNQQMAIMVNGDPVAESSRRHVGAFLVHIQYSGEHYRDEVQKPFVEKYRSAGIATSKYGSQICFNSTVLMDVSLAEGALKFRYDPGCVGSRERYPEPFLFATSDGTTARFGNIGKANAQAFAKMPVKETREMREARQYEEWLARANKGEVEAMLNVGISLTQGDGVSQNKVAAVSWYKKAAALGSVEALNRLGLAYNWGGAGLEVNHAEALRYWRLAEAKNHPKSTYSVGFMYREGLGVGKNEATAMKYFRKAASLGDKEAVSVVDKVDSATPIYFDVKAAQLKFGTRRACPLGCSLAEEGYKPEELIGKPIWGREILPGSPWHTGVVKEVRKFDNALYSTSPTWSGWIDLDKNFSPEAKRQFDETPRLWAIRARMIRESNEEAWADFWSGLRSSSSTNGRYFAEREARAKEWANEKSGRNMNEYRGY